MPRSPSPPGLTTLVLLTATSVLALNMFLPSLVSIAEEFQADYAVVSLSVAGYLAVTAVVNLIAGPVSDRLGRRPVVLAVLVLFALASLGCALAGNVWVFLGFRLLMAGVASGAVVAMAIVRDTRTRQEAAAMIGYISMAMAVAPMLGPMLGGVLDTAFGWRANFWLYAGLGVGLLALCWVDLGETQAERSEAPAPLRRNLATIAKLPVFWAYAICTAASTGAFFVFLAGAPLVAVATFGLDSDILGMIIGSITAGFMLGSFLSGRIAPKVHLTTLMLVGRTVACLGLSAGLVLLISGVLSPLTFFGSTIFVGLGNGLTMPSSNAGAMSVAPGLTGSAAGLNASVNVATGAALTSLTGVILTQSHGPYQLLSLMLATSLVGLLAALMARHLDKTA